MRVGRWTKLLRDAGALSLVAALLAASSASAYSLFTCRDGIARTERCCAKRSAPQATVGSRCCLVTEQTVDLQVSETSRPREAAAPAQLSVLAWVSPAKSPLSSKAWPLPWREKPGEGPPILQQTQSLLL